MRERVRKLLFITSEDGKLFSFPAATRLGYRWLCSDMLDRLSKLGLFSVGTRIITWPLVKCLPPNIHSPPNIKCELSCLSCLVHSHMLVPAVTFSPQAPHSADQSGTARGSAPLGKVSEWIVLAFRCTVRFLPEAASL